MVRIDGQKPASPVHAPTPANPHRAGQIDSRKARIDKSVGPRGGAFSDIASAMFTHVRRLAGRAINVIVPGTARAVSRPVAEKDPAVAREEFINSCHKAWLLAGAADTRPDALAHAVIEAVDCFRALHACGGHAGEHGLLVEEYRRGLDQLIDPLAPARHANLAEAMKTMGIVSRQQDTNG